jgi:trans-aconitate 2-methyltransferase
MPTWNADQYLKFSDERTRPCRDLTARIAVEKPRNIIDLGCGPGNSTEVLAGRWPEAKITGLDSSPDMIAKASASYPAMDWMTGDIGAWLDEPGERFDVVFSNAAMQWVPDHEKVFPQLLSRLSSGGALAVQMPANLDAPAQSLMRDLATQPRWCDRLAGVRNWHSHNFDFYYDAVSPHAAAIEMWASEYVARMDGVEGIVDWYRGTGLRPYLDALGEDSAAFLADYLELLRPAYPVRADGKVLFPFRRIFVVAYRGQNI